ncbi:hypothetical protein [Streptomyces sp. NPDC004546]|uniref:hypothetical protein n=1 Tax=unclassified Streptomyces TaxID=2593676 RepID=UPI0033B727AB
MVHAIPRCASSDHRSPTLSSAAAIEQSPAPTDWSAHTYAPEACRLVRALVDRCHAATGGGHRVRWRTPRPVAQRRVPAGP